MTSRNAGSVRTRTVGSALYNMCVQTGSIISSNVGFLLPSYSSPLMLISTSLDLPYRGLPTLSHRQQSSARPCSVQHGTDHLHEGILHVAERYPREEMGRHERKGEVGISGYDNG